MRDILWNIMWGRIRIRRCIAAARGRVKWRNRFCLCNRISVERIRNIKR